MTDETKTEAAAAPKPAVETPAEAPKTEAKAEAPVKPAAKPAAKKAAPKPAAKKPAAPKAAAKAAPKPAAKKPAAPKTVAKAAPKPAAKAAPKAAAPKPVAKSATTPVEIGYEISEGFAAFVKDRFETNMAFVSELQGVKSPDEFVELHRTYFDTAAKAYSDQATLFNERCQEMFTASFTPMMSSFKDAGEQWRKAVGV